MRSKYIGSMICLTLFSSILLSRPVLADKSDGRNYKVTITNLTKKQVITPPLLVSHRSSYELFSLGQPATGELGSLAEGGNTQPLAALLGTRDDVLDIVVSARPVLPGGSITLEINSSERFNRLSIAGMLATSNDAFFALNGVAFFKNGHQSLTALAYDAGSEANTEVCRDIPGPPCTPESGNQRVTIGAEEFVHIHNGIHGIGDLNAANMDWHNPVARVMIERSR